MFDIYLLFSMCVCTHMPCHMCGGQIPLTYGKEMLTDRCLKDFCSI